MKRCFRCHWFALILLCGVLVVLGCDDDGGSGGSAGAGCDANECKVTASDASLGGFFGRAVALDGDVMLVGSSTDDDEGDWAGAVYVFERDGADWVEVQKFVADDAAPGDLFGVAIALRGDVAIVGAYGEDDNGPGSGAAYIFRNSGTTWSQEAKIQPGDPVAEHGFGSTVGISGDVAVVGAPGDDGDGVGSAAGAAYVFRHSLGTWPEEQKLTASDGAEGDQFGASVAASGAVISVGAPLEGIDPPNLVGTQRRSLQRNSGAGYMFRFDVPVPDTWTEEAKIAAIREPLQCEIDGGGLTEVNDSWKDDHFGATTSLDGDLVAFGSPLADKRVPPNPLSCQLPSRLKDTGSAYIYRFDGGSSWDFERRVIESDPNAKSRLGTQVAIRDGTAEVLALGAPGAQDNGVDSGRGYYVVYDPTGSQWPLEPESVLASDGSLGDRLGSSVSMQNDIMVFGATGTDSAGLNSGAIYVYPVE